MKNYTLSELIFTVCVGSLLLVFMISSVHAVDAKKILCTDNLRKIGSAVAAYAAANKNYVPCQLAKPNKYIPEGSVLAFGNYLGEKFNWSNLLIWGGYLGDKPTAPFSSKSIKTERYRAFVCPDDIDRFKRSDSHSSYFVHVVNDVYALHAKRYGDEQYSRILIGKDRPENSICTDIFTYNGAIYKTNTHKDHINVLRLNGSVEKFALPKRIGNVWNWIGESLDGIEL